MFWPRKFPRVQRKLLMSHDDDEVAKRTQLPLDTPHIARALSLAGCAGPAACSRSMNARKALLFSAATSLL